MAVGKFLTILLKNNLASFLLVQEILLNIHILSSLSSFEQTIKYQCADLWQQDNSNSEGGFLKFGVGQICQGWETAVGECDENIGYGGDDDDGQNNFDRGIDFVSNRVSEAFLILPVSFFSVSLSAGEAVEAVKSVADQKEDKQKKFKHSDPFSGQGFLPDRFFFSFML